jgi:hypothetical protein
MKEWTVVVVGEGPSDLERMQWLLEEQRTLRGASFRFESFDRDQYLQHKKIVSIARELTRSTMVSGHGGKGRGDRSNLRWLCQILIKRKLKRDDVLVLWVRDVDKDTDRKSAFQEVRANDGEHFRHLLGALAEECGEAWVIAGWQAESGEDKRCHADLRQQLGFDPILHPERLSHKWAAPKSAKEVLDKLTGGDKERQRMCLLQAAKEHGANIRDCGLLAFSQALNQSLQTG